MWIERAVEGRIRRSARTRPVIVLTGARQTGKTSTLLHLFPGCDFVSLDLPTEAEQAEKEPALFLERHPRPVIIDEVQYAPRLFRHLKAAVDAERGRNGRFLLTGSQKFSLMKNIADSLAGRADIVELETLSLNEIRGVDKTSRVEAILLRGGFRNSMPIPRSMAWRSIARIWPLTWSAMCARLRMWAACGISSAF